MTAAPPERLARAARERSPLAPVHAARHVVLETVEPGAVTAAVPGVDEAVAESVLVLADFVLGLAVTGTLAAGQRIVTLRLGITRLAAAEPGTALRAAGTLEHADGTVGVSSARITDPAGRTIARATGRNAILRDGSPDGAAAPPEWADRAWPWAALMRVGAPDTDADGTVALDARPGPETANAAGAVQGGALAGVAARALTAQLGADPDELDATFVRALDAGGSAVAATARAEHAGRRLRSGRAEVRDGRGRLLLTASGLAYRGDT